jgi:hypothetical protein
MIFFIAMTRIMFGSGPVKTAGGTAGAYDFAEGIHMILQSEVAITVTGTSTARRHISFREQIRPPQLGKKVPCCLPHHLS